MIGIRVVVIPDDNAAADPRIPKSVIENLSQNQVLMGLNMMYVRKSLWDRMKHAFPLRP
jgi:hypothetical protein